MASSQRNEAPGGRTGSLVGTCSYRSLVRTSRRTGNRARTVLAGKHDEWAESCHYIGTGILAAYRRSGHDGGLEGKDNTCGTEFAIGVILA